MARPKKKILYNQGDEVFRCIICGKFLSVAEKVGITNKCRRCNYNYILMNKKYGAVTVPKKTLSPGEIKYIYDMMIEIMKSSYTRSYVADMNISIESIPARMIIHIADDIIHYDTKHKYPKSWYRNLLHNYLSNMKAKKQRYINNNYEEKIRNSVHGNVQVNAEDLLCVINA